MGKYEKVVPFITEPVVIEVRAGVFHFRARSGRDVYEYAMSPASFAQSVDRSKAALERYGRGEQNVVEGE